MRAGLRSIFPASVVSIALFAAGVVGCGETSLETAVGTNLTRVNQIRSDENLEPQEKRAALAELGLSEIVINSILTDTRVANQFGGTLVTARDKVLAGTFTLLTPDEVQLYADAGGQFEFSDVQAQDIVNLLRSEGIDTADQMKDFLDRTVVDLASSVSEEGLMAVFVDLDPETIIDQLP